MWIFVNYWFLQEINRAQMDLDYTKYTKESLEFIYSEGQKHFDEITKSFREVNSKSYIIIGILFSLLGVLLYPPPARPALRNRGRGGQSVSRKVGWMPLHLGP